MFHKVNSRPGQRIVVLVDGEGELPLPEFRRGARSVPGYVRAHGSPATDARKENRVEGTRVNGPGRGIQQQEGETPAGKAHTRYETI